MKLAGSYIPSFLMAVVLHGLVLWALVANWDSMEAVEVTKVEPYYIDAAIVAENPYKAKARKEAAAAAARERARQARIQKEKERETTRARLEEERLAKQREEQRAAEQAEQDRLARLKAEQDSESDEGGASATEISEEERLRMEQSLALAVMDELEYRRAVTDDEKAMAYVSQIQREIIQNWSRPPSARNGMQALLKVRLVPTGEVVDVAVLESSGNDAFDRSAILAVEKSERFVVPSESRQFERNFREFEVLFRPEDLRL